MCGITGFIDFKKGSNERTAKIMADAMPHRGPDGDGHYFKQTETAQIGFGHRRLSIIDLSHAADQPMHYENLSIVFNGEIYNYQEIRDDLIAKGHHFNTHSDTEVILHAWKEWGEAAIQRWHGMFAIALYDAEKEELICIRDRAGVKPFFYYNNSQQLFLFGSELKTLMAHPRFEKKIDTDVVGSYLQYGSVSGAYCIFENTHKLLPGHLLRLNIKSGDHHIHQYWSVYQAYNKPKLKISLPDAVIETKKVLQKAFQYRMVADVPVGVFLSGGYDSTCVTALLQAEATEKIKTFTIGTTDNTMDEAPFAREIAQQLGTEHNEYYCTAQEALDIIPELPFYYDEPFADSSAIPTMLVSRQARKQVTVALSADAGDEIFAGYNRYDYILKFGEKIRSIPQPLRHAVAFAMSKVSSENIPVLKNKRNFHSRYDKIKNLLRNPSHTEVLKQLSIAFNDDEVQKLMATELRLLPTAHTGNLLKPEYFDTLAHVMAIDYETYMVDDILQKVDRATMSASLEGREPFLDQDVIEWAAQLPSDYKYHNGIKKYLLREIVHQYIPKDLMERPKMGFGIPVADWLQNELKPLVMDYLSTDSLKEHGLFDHHYVQQLVQDFMAGRKEKHLKIWYLLMFQMWYRRWMKG